MECALEIACLAHEPAHYRSDIPGLLDQFRTYEASDPRDKIFAFAALATGTERATISPDYSVPVDVAYRGFVYALISSQRNLHILALSRLSANTRVLVLS